MRLMRADAADDLTILRYPLRVSPKINGFRFGRKDGIFYTSGWKPMKNKAIQHKFRNLPDGWDGEITVGKPNDPKCLARTSSKVTTIDGDAEDVQLHVFDNFLAKGTFEERLMTVDKFFRLEHLLTHNAESAIQMEKAFLQMGYEGMVMRRLDGHYKFGDSTFREHLMLKVKRFADDEALVTGVEPLYTNKNEAKTDVQGYTERSSHQANLMALEMLGSLTTLWREQVLSIGIGWTQQERIDLWKIKDQLPGRYAKFKYLPGGMIELPNPAVFLDWRDPDDMFPK